jgi:hypothetical protein
VKTPEELALQALEPELDVELNCRVADQSLCAYEHLHHDRDPPRFGKSRVGQSGPTTTTITTNEHPEPITV